MVALLSLLLMVCAAPKLYLSQVPTMAVTQVSRAAKEARVDCAGTLQRGREVKQYSAVPLLVKESYVSLGDHVTQGQKLFDVDKERMLQLAGAGPEEWAALSASLEQEVAYSVYQSLQNISSEDLASVPDAVFASETGQLVQYGPDNSEVLPITSPCAVISGAGEMTLRLTVPEEKLGLLQQGDIVSFSPVAYPDLTCYGTISDSPISLQRQGTGASSQTVGVVTVNIEAEDERLVGGMNVNASIAAGDGRSVSVLPYQALRQDENGEYVYLLQGGKACKRYIKTGEELKGAVEVLDQELLGQPVLLCTSDEPAAGAFIKAVQR